jgi:hypothetical protein
VKKRAAEISGRIRDSGAQLGRESLPKSSDMTIEQCLTSLNRSSPKSRSLQHFPLSDKLKNAQITTFSMETSNA